VLRRVIIKPLPPGANAKVAGNSKNKTLRREGEMAILRQRVEFDWRLLKIFGGGGYRLRGSVAFAFNALSLSLSFPVIIVLPAAVGRSAVQGGIHQKGCRAWIP